MSVLFQSAVEPSLELAAGSGCDSQKQVKGGINTPLYVKLTKENDYDHTSNALNISAWSFLVPYLVICSDELYWNPQKSSEAHNRVSLKSKASQSILF